MAECVLPHVESISGGCGVGEVVLVRVADPFVLPSGEAVFTDGQIAEIDARHEATARDYLAAVAGRVNMGSAEVRTHVISSRADDSTAGQSSRRDADITRGTAGRVPDKLIDYVEGSGADLVVVASHGRSGIGRWILGSVADRLLRGLCIPILMVRVPGCVGGI